VPEVAARNRRCLPSVGHLGDHAGYMPIDKAVGMLARLQQRLDLGAQLGIVAASSVEEGYARLKLQL
jgi:hypothetical protein